MSAPFLPLLLGIYSVNFGNTLHDRKNKESKLLKKKTKLENKIAGETGNLNIINFQKNCMELHI